MNRDESLAEGLAALGVAGPVASLAGDASTRRYLRGRRGSRSVVVMDQGAPIPPADAARDPFAFTRWQRFYDGLGIRVPAILAVDRERGLVLLEDLGDELLETRVASRGALACRALYERALAWAATLSREGTARFDPSAAVDEDPLTPARLALEMDLFLVHATGTPLPPSTASSPPLERARAALDGATGDLAAARPLLHALCADVHRGEGAPHVGILCHRDYHARNLLVIPSAAGDDVAVIDFQDTRRGPRAYDLVSLVFDPYVDLPAELAGDLVEAARPAGSSREAWAREVALTAGQRLLKAAGSYAWLGNACGRTAYLQWLEPALSRAHAQLAAWPRRDELWSRLAGAGALTV